MPQAGKGRLNYRCPACFIRELDIDMFYDKEKRNTTVSDVHLQALRKKC